MDPARRCDAANENATSLAPLERSLSRMNMRDRRGSFVESGAMDVQIWITGFGPFVGSGEFPPVLENPSRDIAFALEREPPSGVRVRALELPVSFAKAPAALDRWLAARDEAPHVLLGLGVQSRGGLFRLERRARGALVGDRPDNEGATANSLRIEVGRELSTEFDLERLSRALRRGGSGEVNLSEDAGGYVCERAYHALLSWGERIDCPALFLHIPTIAQVPTAKQIEVVRELVRELSAIANERRRV